MISLLAAALLSASSYRSSFPLGETHSTVGWGVNIHFTHEQPGEVDRLDKAFHWIRMDFAWAGIEKVKGAYDFSAYDELMRSLDEAHVRPVFILDYGNDLYQQGSPRSDESRGAFCRFVSAAVSHFRHRGIVWEMWNEPNISFWRPKPNVQEYIPLALAVGKTIRKEAPDEWYIGPATSGFDWNFLQACLDAGLLNYWDAVSVHPYRPSAPETVLPDWERLRGMIDKAPGARKQPMISGEWGYSDVWGGFDPTVQGRYVGRELLTNTMAGIALSIYYDWKNDGTSPTDSESHFGSVNLHLSPKPAYSGVVQLVSELKGYRYEERMKLDSPDDYVLVFRRGGRTLLVGWTTSAPHAATLPGKRSIGLTPEASILLPQHVNTKNPSS